MTAYKDWPVIIGILFIITHPCYAQEYVIGVENQDYHPYYYNENKQFKGFSRKLFERFAKHKNISFKYRILPIKRLFSQLLNGQIDFKFPDNPQWNKKNKERHNIYYSDSIIRHTDGIITLQENQILNIKDITRLGLLRGFTPFFVYSETYTHIRYFENNAIESLIGMLEAEYIDGVYIDIRVARIVTKEKWQKSITFNKNLPFETSDFYISSKKHPDIIKDFNEFTITKQKWIKDLKTSYQF